MKNMPRLLKRYVSKILKDSKGQSLVLIALLMTVIMGAAALAIDVGTVVVTKSKLQSAVDAAALAGAQALQTTKDPVQIAKDYAELNGIDKLRTTAVTPYNGQDNKIEVVSTKTISYTFARVLGFTSIDVTERAVAQKVWAGEALPFINLVDDYTITTTNPEGEVWTKVAPGVNEVISDFYTQNQGSSNLYFEVEYLDGVTLEMGFSNGQKGLDDSKLKDGVDVILSDAHIGSKMYVLSLRADIIQSMKSGGTFKVTDKHGYIQNRTLSNIQQGDIIDPNQLVLIECEYISSDINNNHHIELKYLNKAYDIMNGEFPTDYVGTGDAHSKLVE